MPSHYFPNLPIESENPAIQLFGKRLFRDQTVSELLVEFMLVSFSNKKIGSSPEFSSALPDLEMLSNWNDEKLLYAPKARLNLKLFSFLGASRLESRHYTHRDHYKELIKRLKESIDTSGGCNKDDTVRTIEDLFLGFQGVGRGRTWCAQSFLPISRSLLACESIWKETKAKDLKDKEWHDLFDGGNNYFDRNQHVFLARGGELIYLQLCNALKQPSEKIKKWCSERKLEFSSEEQDPIWLRNELESSLNQFIDQCPQALSELAEFIDTYLDPDSPTQTDGADENLRFVPAGFCNIESWQEGYLFAVDLLKLLKSNIGIIDRIYLLETACAMQVLRTLAMQSVRAQDPIVEKWPGYWLAVSAPNDNRAIIKRLSQHSVKEIEKLVFNAIRNTRLVDLPTAPEQRQKVLKQTDQGYGGKLFLGLSKRIELIVPKRGAGARFVINDQLLRLLVVTTVPQGKRLTFDTFLGLLERRYGLVFGEEGYMRANQWLGGQSSFLSIEKTSWLQEMLEAAGFLIHLSDSFALVHNPADNTNNKQ